MTGILNEAFENDQQYCVVGYGDHRKKYFTQNLNRLETQKTVSARAENETGWIAKMMYRQVDGTRPKGRPKKF